MPVNVETDAGSHAATGKSWAWLPRPSVAHGEADFAAIDERVRAGVARELGARHLKKVDRERPDYLITYYVAIDKPIAAASITYAAGVPVTEKVVSSYERGSLVIDVLDARTGKLVWRGAARRVFAAQQTPDDRNERIDAAVASVVEDFASN